MQERKPRCLLCFFDAGPDEFAKFMKSEIARWTKVANVAGIKKG